MRSAPLRFSPPRPARAQPLRQTYRESEPSGAMGENLQTEAPKGHAEINRDLQSIFRKPSFSR